MLTQQTKDIVKATIPALEMKGVEITTIFYKHLFEDYPQLLNIFNQTNQKKGRQQTALANTVLAAAKHIDNLGAIIPVVKQIAHKHRSLTVKPEHYPIVGKYLLAAIKEVLGDAATDEILQAWGEAYGVIAQVFIDIEKEMYENATNQEGGWLDFKDFIIVDKVKESSVITSFYLKASDGKVLPEFQPGQYVTIRIKIAGEEYLVNRQYSLSAAPGKDSYRISVKRESMPNTPEGRTSNFLHDHMNVGDLIELTAPAGEFTLNLEQNTPVVFLSAGVGITPFMSMVHAISDKQPERNVTFVHASQNGTAQAFKEELKAIKESIIDYRLSFAYSDPSEEDMNEEYFEKAGYVDAEMLNRLEVDDKANYYICGPVPFLQAMLGLLKDRGLAEEQIHFEFFGPAIQLG
ncbi:NO-inducible flavohemoprotein [Peribacillus huizhouensis]|uniref:Flavohemoprotein n=1 Tax=Peribacillus huizhouensis TaxID=1501239 RepID=A0ABR6CKS9_9BACI|nr:NO-inducible flavohemoprotein [Peribacillus huizhouensis]MBA9025140.1 nitric oxide dioxygenase [Peribacillus huizhouensis]